MEFLFQSVKTEMGNAFIVVPIGRNVRALKVIIELPTYVFFLFPRLGRFPVRLSYMLYSVEENIKSRANILADSPLKHALSYGCLGGGKFGKLK